MGCHQCTSKQKPQWAYEGKKVSFLAPTLHYSVNFVPQCAYLNNLKREDLETLYKALLYPFQLKLISPSNSPFYEPLMPIDTKDNNNFEGMVQNLHVELISASESWPLDTSSSIFAFLIGEKDFKIKAFMTGTKNTPFAHGLFEFDLIFQNVSPFTPEIRFLTGGNNRVVFGPKLSENKKIEFKTLFEDELQIENRTISDILLGLYSLINKNDLYDRKSEDELLSFDLTIRNRMYKARENIAKFYTIQYGMLSYITNPVSWLRDFIHTYFYLKKDIILNQCKKWLLAAQTDDAIYEDMGIFENSELVSKFKEGKYFEELRDLIKTLETELSRIKIHIRSPIIAALGQAERESQFGMESPISAHTQLSLDFDNLER